MSGFCEPTGGDSRGFFACSPFAFGVTFHIPEVTFHIEMKGDLPPFLAFQQ
jgi:hypothetical protein